MAEIKKYIAVDLGAESGRVMLGSVSGDKLILEEIHRFNNGPIEATASGNILMQAKATGQIKSLAELREIVRNSFELKEYQPKETQLWDKQYEKLESDKGEKSFD